MKKTMVKSSDYELYKVPLPWKLLLRNDRNSFIVGELEKRHPRFSGNCCYDTRYLIEKHNLIADVVVMEKASLAEYKHFGGELFLEKEKKRNVFSGKARIMRFLTIFLILLAGILSFRIVISLLEDEASFVELVSENDDSAFVEEASEKTTSAEKLVDEVFASVSGRGGKISSFSFSCKNAVNERTGLCKFSIYGCNAEEVANARYCVVSFKDNEPHFELVLPFSEKGSAEMGFSEKRAGEVGALSKEQNLPEGGPEQDVPQLSVIRNSLRSLGALIESEHDEEDCAEIIFHTPPSKMYSCLKTCAEEAENFGWCEKNLIVSMKEDLGKISVSFEKNHDGEEVGLLRRCAQYAYLFTPELKLLPKKTRLFTLGNGGISGNGGELFKDSKIGEIRKKDGSVLICVRNEDGRIAYKNKEVVNAH